MRARARVLIYGEMMSTDTYGPAAPAAPVKQAPRRGAGRPPAPNPFLPITREVIDLARGGAPEDSRGRSVPFALESGERYQTRANRIRRQLTAAGRAHGEADGRGPYWIRRDIEENPDGTYTLTVWARL